jgi:PhnB protein
MPLLNCYLNFPGTAEKAFNFYKSVFGGDLLNAMRYSEVPNLPGGENLSKEELNSMMHVALKIGNNILMATDCVKGMGQEFKMGNYATLSIHTASREEADKFYKALSQEGQAHMPMSDMFWGDYWGMLTDKFGIPWMINFSKQGLAEV